MAAMTQAVAPTKSKSSVPATNPASSPPAASSLPASAPAPAKLKIPAPASSPPAVTPTTSCPAITPFSACSPKVLTPLLKLSFPASISDPAVCINLQPDINSCRLSPLQCGTKRAIRKEVCKFGKVACNFGRWQWALYGIYDLPSIVPVFAGAI